MPIKENIKAWAREVISSLRRINYGLTKNMDNFWIKETMTNCYGCRIRAK
jgi:hypothetical protein